MRGDGRFERRWRLTTQKQAPKSSLNRVINDTDNSKVHAISNYLRRQQGFRDSTSGKADMGSLIRISRKGGGTSQIRTQDTRKNSNRQSTPIDTNQIGGM